MSVISELGSDIHAIKDFFHKRLVALEEEVAKLKAEVFGPPEPKADPQPADKQP